MYKSLRQKVTFGAPPKAVYALLMDAGKHAAFSGAPVQLVAEVGGTLSAFGGQITGINVELVRNKRIVQMWRSGSWPTGHHSTATFEFEARETGTLLTFTQTGIPASALADITDGWKKHYWVKMKAALKSGRIAGK